MTNRPNAAPGPELLSVLGRALKSLVEGSSEAFYVKDSAGRYLFANEAAARLVSRSPAAVVGRSDQDLFDAASAARIGKDDRRVREAGRPELFERELATGGRQRRLLVTKWPWREPESGETYLLGISRDITDQSRAERALRESERRFRTIVENAPEAIVLLDMKKGTFVDANSNAERLFGLSREELAQVGPVEMSPPTQPNGRPSSELAQAMLSVAEEGERPSFEWVHRNAKGEDIPCEIRLVRMPDDPRIIRGSIIDISERKRAQRELEARELALSASEARYRKLVEQSLVGVLIYQQGRIVFTNPAMARTLGYSAKELLQFSRRRARALIHPENRQLVIEREGSRLRGINVAPRNSYRVVHRDGSSRWLETFSSVIDYGGEPALLLAAVDITAQREAEEALRSSEGRHRTLLRALPDPVFVLDEEGCISELHAERSEDLPHPASELLGRRFLDILAEEAKGPCEVAIAAALRSGKAHTFSYTSPSRNAAARAGQQEFEARVASAGSERTVIVLREITERSELEARLRQAQKMDAVGRLAGGVAHDFNNLLTVLMGNAELGLTMLQDGHPVRGHFDQILRATEQAASLTRQLLMFSRQKSVTKEVVDVNELVTRTRSMLRRLIEEDITLTTRLDPRAQPVAADRSQLEQVLVNLAVNSRDAMARSGGDLEVVTGIVTIEESASTSFPLAAGTYTTIEVRDNGVGIPPELRRHLFEPFLTTKPVGKGTGLGLATSYGIVQQHGGYIEIESEVGVGTTVRVYLPVVDDLPAPAEETIRESIPGGSETMVVAEDDDAVRDFLCESLSDLGYRVLPARDGHEALQLLESESGHVDLLLTDVVMPGMGGRELAERARRQHPRLEVLFASGYTDDVILERQLVEEGLDLVRKPFRVPVLAARLRALLDPD